MELEVGSAAGDRCICLFVAVGAGGGDHHLTGNELEDILLSHGQCLQILPAGGLGGDNGMVVRDLFRITELFPIDFIRNGQIADARGPQKNLFHTGQHIVRQIPAVRSGVGTELLFIECLQIIQCLLGRIPQQAVGFPLQAGQVIQRRGGFFLLLLTNLFDNGGICCLAGCRKSFRLRFCGKAVTDRMELSQSQVNRVIAFRSKRGNGALPLYQQGQRGRHDPADIQLGLVGQTEKPAGVDAHQPVRLGTTKGTLVQGIIVPAGGQVRKAVLNGTVLHGGNPQPLHWLPAVGQIVHRAENQLALPSGIAGIDDLRHVFPVHKGAQDAKLFLFVRGNEEAEGAGQDGQVLQFPLGIVFVIGSRICQTGQMAVTPGNQIRHSLAVAIPALGSSQHPRQILGNGGLFCNHQLHTVTAFF